MEFTEFERIQLINQFEILKILNPGEKENYEGLIEILFNGYSILYSDIENYLPDDMPVEDGLFVLDILSLYRVIEGYKFQHDSKAIANHPNAAFAGFDLDQEGNYYRLARFLMDKQKRFGEQEQYRGMTDGFNSHRPMLPRYRGMVSRWERLGRKTQLDESEILAILNSWPL